MTVKEIIKKCNAAMLGDYDAGALTKMEMLIGTPPVTTVLQTVLKKVYSIAGLSLLVIGGK